MKTREELKEIYNRKHDLELLKILEEKSQYEVQAIEVVEEIIAERGGENAIREAAAKAERVAMEEATFRDHIRKLLKDGKYENEIREELIGDVTDEDAFEVWLDEELDAWEDAEEEKKVDGGTIGRAAIGAAVGALVGGLIFGFLVASMRNVAGPGAGVILICYSCVKFISGKSFFNWATLVFSVVSVIGAIIVGFGVASLM